ncbi:DUF5994 family protein [Streptomyces sp. NPDC058391]|uniref:DUF5994 family protein n=1 Tax=Streptomyces sp. NPDC058391 TaxID=3346476 RepID=UPI0036531567
MTADSSSTHPFSTHPFSVLTAHPAGLLPDTLHRRVAPGTVLLRLRTTSARDGPLDGAWWPHSRETEVELPALVTALTEHLGPLTRIGLDTVAWDEAPGRLIIDGRAVRIDWSPTGDDTVLVTRGENDHFALLVVPPRATRDAAREAMAKAVLAGNSTEARQILIDTGINPERAERRAKWHPRP